MVMRQKQAFTRMQSQCELLVRQQAKMQTKMHVMEYETRSLRVLIASCSHRSTEECDYRGMHSRGMRSRRRFYSGLHSVGGRRRR